MDLENSQYRYSQAYQRGIPFGGSACTILNTKNNPFTVLLLYGTSEVVLQTVN